MKTKVLFMAAIAAMAFTSCQKAENPELNVPEGQDTYIGMTIQLPESATRAFQGDPNAIAEECKLNTVTVGTWSGNGAVTYTDLVIGDLTNNGNGTYTANKAVKAKTGTNNIIVLTNTATKPTIQQINGDAFAATVASIATANAFVMYSDKIEVLADVKLASKTEAEGTTFDATNKATVTLRRAAAKVTVSSSLGETVAGVADGLGNGLLTNIVWNIANQNTQMTVFPKYVDAAKGFISSNVNSPFTRLAAVAPTTVLPAAGANAVVAYCLENAHGADVYKENNTTAVQVSAVFTPGAGKYVSAITGPSATATFTFGAAPMTGGTFYVSKSKLGTQAAGTFFSTSAFNQAKTIFSLDDADKVAAAFTEYTDGKCFWAVWINDGAAKPSYGVLRNHMYSMNITKINAPGFEKFPDTENPIAADTWIKVDLTVEKWNAKTMGDIEL